MQRQVKLFLFMCFITGTALAQKPHVASFEPKSATVKEKVTINGTGFSSDKSKLVVRIGDINAHIESSTENRIEIRVPAGCNYDQIHVTNLSSKLSGASRQMFMLSYHGNEFKPDRVFNREFNTGGPVNSLFFDFLATDLNDDLRPDIVSSNDNGMGIYTSLNNPINVDDDNLSLGSKTTSISVATKYFAQGDLNGDGKTDLVVTRGGTPVDRVFVFTNTSTRSTISYSSNVLNLEVPGSNNLQKVDIADVDNDGKPDIIVADNTDDGNNNENNIVHIFKNTSSGGVTKFSEDLYTIKIVGDPNFRDGSFTMEAKDINGDNYPEIITSPPFGGTVCVIKNESVPGRINFTDKKTFAVSGPLSDIKVGDVDGDGKNDVVTMKYIQNQANYVYILYNKTTNNNDIQLNASNISINKTLDDIDLGDMNGDGLLDLVFSTRDNVPVVGVLINKNGTNFEEYLLGATSKHYQVRVKDINSDGRPDILVAQTNGKLGVYFNRNCRFPDITPSDDVTLCNGSDYTLQAPQGIKVTYVWSKNGIPLTETSNSLKPTSTGEYKVTIKSDLATCSQPSPPVNVNFIAGTPPSVSASNNGPGCLNGNLQLNATTVNNATYSWTGPNDFTSTQQNPIVTGFDANKAGKYIVDVQVNGGCSSNKDTTTAEIITLPSLDISGPNTICNGQAVTLEVQNYPNHQYYWKFNGSEIPGANNASVNVDQVGTYQVVVGKSGCEEVSPEFKIESFPLPTAAFTTDASICMNDTLSITNSTTIPNQEKPVYYEWFFGTGNIIKDKDPVFAYKTSGDFTISLKVGYENSSCFDETTQSINVVGADPLSITAPITNFCKGDSVLLTASGDFGTYQWSTGASGKEVYVTDQGEITVTAENTTGCKSIAQKLLTYKPIPLPIEIITEPEDTVLSFGDTRKLLPQNVGYTLYKWTPEIYLDDATFKEPTAKPFKTITYTLQAKDEGKCWAFGEITLVVDGEGPELTYDKLFSPNGDGMNDLWVIEDIEEYQNQLAIFNRNGEKVYEISNYFNDWDGRNLSGRELPNGVYYFVIKYLETNTSQGGSVLITR